VLQFLSPSRAGRSAINIRQFVPAVEAVGRVFWCCVFLVYVVIFL
jgi:hypothetical protein